MPVGLTTGEARSSSNDCPESGLDRPDVHYSTVCEPVGDSGKKKSQNSSRTVPVQARLILTVPVCDRDGVDTLGGGVVPFVSNGDSGFREDPVKGLYFMGLGGARWWG